MLQPLQVLRIARLLLLYFLSSVLPTNRSNAGHMALRKVWAILIVHNFVTDARASMVGSVAVDDDNIVSPYSVRHTAAML